jgi:hypothetical protein
MMVLSAMGAVFVVGLVCVLFYLKSNPLGVLFIALVGSSTIAMMSVSFDFAPELLFLEGSNAEGISSAILNIATNIIGGAMVFIFQALPTDSDGSSPYVFWFTCSQIALAFVVLNFVKPEYKRIEHEEAQRGKIDDSP